MEKTRKQRKNRFIRAKNRVLRDTECGNGLYWCNHVYDPEHPWCWVDFTFLSQRHKNRYFAVAMTTCEYAALEDIENAAWDEADKVFADPGSPTFKKVSGAEFGLDDKVFEAMFSDEQLALSKSRYNFVHDLARKNAQTPIIVRPKIEVDRDYGPVAIGLLPTVNTPFINNSVIRKFIADYRALGEPITKGIVWEGDEVEIVPGRLYENYKRGDKV